ncbi:MAG TPA: hypothetical protein VMV92_41420 [Streptosporangiaceae bacterium]|nr:hypothetical protein [Streptosporangiaceae bacterium]
MRLTPGQRELNEQKIRAAAGQLLSGDIPAGGRCDVKTLARLAGVDRAAFYGSRPYAALRQDFESRIEAMHAAGEHPDPRDARIARLTAQITTLTTRLDSRNASIAELSAFRQSALSRLAAQHDEITRLRRAGQANIRRLPGPAAGPGS